MTTLVYSSSRKKNNSYTKETSLQLYHEFFFIFCKKDASHFDFKCKCDKSFHTRMLGGVRATEATKWKACDGGGEFPYLFRSRLASIGISILPLGQARLKPQFRALHNLRATSTRRACLLPLNAYMSIHSPKI